MTDTIVDSLARHLAGSSARRDIVAGLTSALLAAVPLALGGDLASARRKHKRKKRKKKQSDAAPVPPPLLELPPPPPPSPPPCVGSCAGKRCGDDGCGASCGACAGGSVCESGQCVAACCGAGVTCFEGYCTCATPGSDFRSCSCPAGDVICNGAGCCLAGDTCLTPMDCFDGEICTCSTQTCGAGNDACREEFAFCGNGAPGTCGCFTRTDDSPFCATIPAGPFCPERSECERDDECGDGKVCAKVPCCNLAVQPFVGWCLTSCP
jgi:hypothetical protein